MLSWDYSITLGCERHLYLQERRVLLLLWPHELHENRGCPSIDWSSLFELLVVIEFVPVQLDTGSGHVNVSLANRPKVPPCYWVELVCVKEGSFFKNEAGIEIEDLEKHKYVWL